MWASGDDVESQQKGLILLLWPAPDISKSIKIKYPMNNGGELVKKVLQCVPMRVAAFHFCTPGNDPFFQVLRSVFAWTLACGNKRSRLRFHSGQSVELMYNISGYGIPVDLLPLTSTGNVKTTYLKQWIRLRIALEEDILSGKTYLTSISNGHCDNTMGGIGNGLGNGIIINSPSHPYQYHRHKYNRLDHQLSQ